MSPVLRITGEGPASAPRFPGVPKQRAKPRHHEHEQQCLFFQMVRTHPKTRDLVIYSVPNSALAGSTLKDKLRMVRAVKEGLTEGVPDINVDEPVDVAWPKSKGHGEWMRHGLRIEMKRDDQNKNGTQKAKPTPAQLAIHEKLSQRGFVVAICYSATEAYQVLLDYLAGKL